MDATASRDPLGVPDPELWELPDHLTWEECLEETSFPARRPDRSEDGESSL